MADDQEQFENATSGASQTFPMQCSALRKNGYVCIKDRPCKIVEMSTSKTGKHGHAKVHLVAIDIFTGKKLEDLCPSTHNMNVPVANRIDYECVGMEDEFLTLMAEDGTTREDLKVPEGDVGVEIRDKLAKEETFQVTILSAMGQEMAVGTKNVTK